MGAALATISTQAEDELVSNLMVNVNQWTWIGLSYIEKEGEFVWQNSSTKTSYLNWGYNGDHQEPDGSGNCVVKPGPENSEFNSINQYILIKFDLS